jgi:hypothetical protein
MKMPLALGAGSAGAATDAEASLFRVVDDLALDGSCHLASVNGTHILLCGQSAAQATAQLQLWDTMYGTLQHTDVAWTEAGSADRCGAILRAGSDAHVIALTTTGRPTPPPNQKKKKNTKKKQANKHQKTGKRKLFYFFSTLLIFIFLLFPLWNDSFFSPPFLSSSSFFSSSSSLSARQWWSCRCGHRLRRWPPRWDSPRRLRRPPGPCWATRRCGAPAQTQRSMPSGRPR